MILNLMPCVFPVLAIKVVSFVHVKDQATRVSAGLAYSAGVVLSFLALGALLLGRRASSSAGAFSCKALSWWRRWPRSLRCLV